ncbi:AraC family transcriptional regulator, partial [Enterococcus sp. 2CBP]
SMETDNFDNLLLIYYTVGIITLLTRIVIIEGVCEKEAYSLSDAYLGLNFKKLKVEPIQFICEIVENFMILIENEKFYKYNSQLVNKIINYVKNNVNSNLKVIQIANHFHISPEYLSYHFKNVTGMSLKSFINQEKIEFSKYLLSSTDLTIMEITIALNYTDQSYFSKVFKKYTKVSPSQY